MLSRREEEKLRKEAAIIKEAEELFCINGFEHTSMNEIAQRAGYTKRTVYQYFTCKEDLFFAVILKGYERLWAAVKESTGACGTGFEKLRRAYFAFYTLYREHPRLLALMGMTGLVKGKSETLDLPYRRRFYEFDRRMFDGICALFRAGQEDGSVRADIGTGYLMYAAVFSLTGFFHMLSVTGKAYLGVADMDEDKFIETGLQLFLDSVKSVS
ncbi:TetR/AcrR family transcriptional regulator [Christensenella intestinihominis]|uniref:TetR/AcrR family transcriptional regulator n=1 Tax=Christensenella intestinihominis TaxID=1851429 RepID=UPI00082DB762|nr:TetR/AcrR family transcriptional regulator [Christensenella intestinihominis]